MEWIRIRLDLVDSPSSRPWPAFKGLTYSLHLLFISLSHVKFILRVFRTSATHAQSSVQPLLLHFCVSFLNSFILYCVLILNRHPKFLLIKRFYNGITLKQNITDRGTFTAQNELSRIAFYQHSLPILTNTR